MIKKTLYFGNPAYLSLSNRQLVIKLPEVEKNPDDGTVGVLRITDKQFADIKIFYCKKEKSPGTPYQQPELF